MINTSFILQQGEYVLNVNNDVAFAGLFAFISLFVLFLIGVPILQDRRDNAREKRRADEEKTTHIPSRRISEVSDLDIIPEDRTIYHPSPTAPITHSKKTEEEKSLGSYQITIYSFSKRLEKQICRFCDGENSEESKVCSICNRDL